MIKGGSTIRELHDGVKIPDRARWTLFKCHVIACLERRSLGILY